MTNPSPSLRGLQLLQPATALLAALLGLLGVSEADAAPVGQATVEGGLDKPAVRAVVAAHIDEVRECYEAELVDDATVEGRSVVSLVIRPDGSVSEVGITETTMPTRFDGCVITAVEAWSFPASDAATHVVYPFVMSPG